MTQINGAGSVPSPPAANTNTPPSVPRAARPWWDPDGLHWTDVERWWETPALAYLAGLHDGTRLERERTQRQDEALHRAAVRSAIKAIDQADARAAADAPGARPGDWQGVTA